MSYNVVSTFSGCGGSSLGYKLAGLKVLAANEFIDEAVATYRANHKDTIMFDGDIRQLTGDYILEKLNLKKGELDILDGSPPCASFSFVGKRTKKWGKVTKYSDKEQRVDDLFFEFTRLLEEIQPKTFVAENVSALAFGHAKNVFEQVLNSMRSKGYKVRCRLLNAKYLNVPQNRPRLIFIGVREDLGIIPTHPLPQCRPITLRDALANVVNTEEDIKNATYKADSSVMPYLLKMKPGEDGKKYSPTKGYYSLIRLRWDEPSRTILQADAKQTSSQVVHPTEHRRLTIPEIKAVSTFPQDFILTGSYKQQWERIGRAVPPFMMKAVAEHVKYFILDKINGTIDKSRRFEAYSIKNDTLYSLTYDEYNAILESNEFKEYDSSIVKENVLF